MKKALLLGIWGLGLCAAAQAETIEGVRFGFFDGAETRGKLFTEAFKPGVKLEKQVVIGSKTIPLPEGVWKVVRTQLENGKVIDKENSSNVDHSLSGSMLLGSGADWVWLDTRLNSPRGNMYFASTQGWCNLNGEKGLMGEDKELPPRGSHCWSVRPHTVESIPTLLSLYVRSNGTDYVQVEHHRALDEQIKVDWNKPTLEQQKLLDKVRAQAQAYQQRIYEVF